MYQCPKCGQWCSPDDHQCLHYDGSFRILVLDVNRIQHVVRELRARGVRVEVTALEHADIWSNAGYGSYRVSHRGLDWARHAAGYDAIIIGNNRGTGFAYAREIPDAMKPHTLIIWNDRSAADEEAYARFGFEHFGKRNHDETDWLLGQAQHLTAEPEAAS
jgi:hypothetical protein